MAIDFKRILSCFSSNRTVDYESLGKKFDQDYQEETKNWIAANQIEPNLKQTSDVKLQMKKTEEFAKKVIATLRKIPINSSNIDLISDHLAAICKKDHIARSYLIEHISSIGADEKITSSLKDRMTFTSVE